MDPRELQTLTLLPALNTSHPGTIIVPTACRQCPNPALSFSHMANSSGISRLQPNLRAKDWLYSVMSCSLPAASVLPMAPIPSFAISVALPVSHCPSLPPPRRFFLSSLASSLFKASSHGTHLSLVVPGILRALQTLHGFLRPL